MNCRAFRCLFAARWLIAGALLFCCATATPALSQGDALITEQRAVLETLSKSVDDVAKRIEAGAEDDSQLVAYRLNLESINDRVLTSGVAFKPRLAEINARLEQLGPAPANGQPAEPELVATERTALTGAKAQINATLGIAESLSIRVHGLVEQIAETRRELFSSVLTKRFEIDYALAGEVLDAFQTESAKFVRTVSSWLHFVVQFKLRSVLLATFFALGAAAILLIGGRRLFSQYLAADLTLAQPSYLSRLSVAFWSTLLPSATLCVFLGATFLLFDFFEVLRGDIGAMMVALFTVIAIVYLVYRLARAVLSPRMPQWRLLPVDTRAAPILVWLVTCTAVFAGVDYFLGEVYRVMGSPLALSVGESLAATVIIGVFVILIGLVRPFVDETGRPRRWPVLLRVLLFLLGGFTIAAALFGFVGLARFVSRQLVITGAILATMYLGFLSAHALSQEHAFAHTALGRRIGTRFRQDEAKLDQLGLGFSIATNLLILAVGVPLILLQWGFQLGDIRAWTYSLATGFKVGSVTFSLTGILTGMVVFVVGYVLTRWFQGWLDGSVMARGRVDAGVRNSIRLVVGYAGVAFAALFAISAAGIDLSSLALVAGALSLGIGFGLQNVVSNFVSGLILLAERPFKVGDWIVAGDVSGTVRKISVRATEIETFQRQSVMLPNSNLINNAVGNWTHRNKLGRVDVRVNVAYDSDARRAHSVMLEIAKAHRLVLKVPEPFVLFANFGPAALEFEVRVFLADVLDGRDVQNDIRFAVLERFEREGIVIPSTPRAETDADREAEPEPAAAPPGFRG